MIFLNNICCIHLLFFYAGSFPIPDPIVQNGGYVSAKRVTPWATLSGEY